MGVCAYYIGHFDLSEEFINLFLSMIILLKGMCCITLPSQQMINKAIEN